ncbi:MAG: TonB-dependent receptor [Erythrobacter sp.]|uniref:TonB-dependent receptor n=1 Tax=Erythrobacter sp. TaxID=1042 RepID=UPI0032988551
MISRHTLLLASVASIGLAQPTMAQAQAQQSEDESGAQSDGQSASVEDVQGDAIIVTADRREQTLQDFAGTAFAISGEDLRALGVQNVTDLQNQIPGLSVANNQGNVEVFIRGIGSTNNTELGDPAAAFHLDGVNIPRPSGIGSAFHDIQRVEVNVGPQGTLRGRNATAGSINAITFRPGLGGFDGSVEAEYGNFDHRSLRGVLNIPLADTVAVRFSGLYQENDSYYDNVGPVEGIDVAESQDNLSGRAQILWEPTDRLSILVAGDYISETGTGYTGTNFALPLGALEDGDITQAQFDDIDPRDVIARGITPEQDTDHWGIRTTIEYKGDGFNVEYIGSYRDAVYDYEATTPLSPDFPGVLDRLSERDNIFTPEPGDVINDPIILQENLDNFSRFRIISDSRSHFHELRVSNSDGPFIWSLGALYINEDQRSFLGSTGDRGLFFQGIEFNTQTETDSYAFYGDATYEVSDNFRLTGGLRYTDDQKERTGVAARYGLALGGGSFECCGGVRVGTEGFEFAAFDRTIINPDTDGDGAISDAEVFAFQADGVAQFGGRDNLGDILANGPQAIFATPFPDGGDGTILTTPCIDTISFDFFNCDGFTNGAFDPATFPINPGAFTFTVPFGGQIFQQDGEFQDDFVDWRVRAEYDISPDNLLYALVANGHKSGGFNDNLGDNGVAPTFGTESVVLYEIGSKNEFDIGGRRAYLNASFFYNDYTDQVFTGLLSVATAIETAVGILGQDIPVPPGTNTDLVVSFSFNAADSEIYGAQVEGGFGLPGNIDVDFTVLWLEAQIQNSQEIPDFRFQPDVDSGNAVFRPIDGNRLPRTPRWQLNGKVSQVIELPQGQLDWVASFGYRSSQFHTIFNSLEFDTNGVGTPVTGGRLLDQIDGYLTVDIGAGWTIDDEGKYRFEVYGNNVTNQQEEAAIVITQFDNTRFFTRPRTYGARIRARF